jgi:cell division control protein 6
MPSIASKRKLRSPATTSLPTTASPPTRKSPRRCTAATPNSVTTVVRKILTDENQIESCQRESASVKSRWNPKGNIN